MKWIFWVVKDLSRYMNWIAGFALVSIMFLTVSDVILRRLGMPIDWAFEIVVLLGGMVIGFSLPETTLTKGHVAMEFLIEKVPWRWHKMFNVITRLLAMLVFAIFAWKTFSLAGHLSKYGQVSAVLRMPEYPVVYGISFCCFLVFVILFVDLLAELKKEDKI